MKYTKNKPNRGSNNHRPAPYTKTKTTPTVVLSDENGTMRLNKYLAHQGVATRRGADELIAKGLIKINGRVANLGDRVTPTDEVELIATKGMKKTGSNLVYYAYNKPANANIGNQSGDRQFYTGLKGKSLFPADQLDKRDSGLVIITNDGRLTTRLLNPEFEVEKEYLVTTRNNIHENFREKVKSDLTVDGNTILPKKIKVLGDKTIIITLTAGGRHEVQSLFSIMFNDIAELERTAIANINLGKQAPGTFREITGDELDEFLEILKIPKQ